MSEDKLALVTAKLSKREHAAYEYMMKYNQPKIAPTRSAEMYQLFLHGKSCEEISRLNPGFSLGQIVRARVDEEWDDRRDRHLAELLENARSVVQQRQMESILLLTDYMGAFNKLFGDKLKKYISTGNVQDLDGIPFNLKQYKEVLELMLKLTGQDKKEVKGEVLHKHVSEQPIPAAPTGLTQEQAAQVLMIIDQKNENKD